MKGKALKWPRTNRNRFVIDAMDQFEIVICGLKGEAQEAIP